MTIQSVLKRLLGSAPASGAEAAPKLPRPKAVARPAGEPMTLAPLDTPADLDPLTRFFAAEAGLMDELLGTLVGQLRAGQPLDPAALAEKVQARRGEIRERGLKLALTPKGKLPVAEAPAALIAEEEARDPAGKRLPIATDLSLDAQLKAIAALARKRNNRALLAMKARLNRDFGSKRGNLPRDLVDFLLAVEYLVPDKAAAVGERIFAWDNSHRELPADLRRALVEKLALAHAKLGDYARAKLRWAELREGNELGDAGLHLMFADMMWREDPDAALTAIDLARTLGDKVSPGYLLLQLTLLLEHRGVGAAEAMLATRPRMGSDAIYALYNLALRRDGFALAQHYLQHAFTLKGLAYPRFNGRDTIDVNAMASDLADLPRAAAIHGKRPLVTVVVTAFDAAGTIAAALASLLAQTWRELEIIVVDDRSTDETADIVEALAQTDRRVRLLRNEGNIGTYLSRNRAMSHARGAFVTFQDSDDWSHPQRIERHMEVMGAEPHVMVSKSQWLRVLPDGSLPIRRWSRCFAHGNPSSLFFRREALEATGYFDAVRADADFEMARRIDLIFAKPAVRSIALPLSLGFVGLETLTKSGPTAMDEQGYSPVRAAYKDAWVGSYAERLGSGALALPVLPEAYGYAVPPELETGIAAAAAWFRDEAAPGALPDADADAEPRSPGAAWGDRPPFWFIISLASAQSSADWARTVAVFRNTLRAILAQDDPDFRVVVSGHERPEIAEIADPRVEFIVSDRRPPTLPKDFRADKMWKRRLIFQRIKQAGGGYVMPVDADDLVSRRIVGHVRSRPVTTGFVVVTGYALDWSGRRLSAVPGAWTAPFERVCGSSAIFLFEAADLPSLHQEEVTGVAAAVLGPHANWRLTAEEVGRPLEEIPFPASVYVVNTAVNLSFAMQRAGERANSLLANLARAEVEATPAIVEEFALGELFAAPPAAPEHEAVIGAGAPGDALVGGLEG